MMDSSNKPENAQQLSGNEPEEQGGEDAKSSSEIDIFAGHEFESPGREETEPVSSPEQSPGDENRISGSRVSSVTEDVSEGAVEQEAESDSASTDFKSDTYPFESVFTN